MVVARDFALHRSFAYFSAPGVLYFARYARSIASRNAFPRARRATTAASSFFTWIAPCGSVKNVRYQPFSLTLHDRTNTRSFITTCQMPMNRCPALPARIRNPMLLCSSSRSPSGNCELVFTSSSPDRARCSRLDGFKTSPARDMPFKKGPAGAFAGGQARRRACFSRAKHATSSTPVRRLPAASSPVPSAASAGHVDLPRPL
jgi:hypothetical protein